MPSTITVRDALNDLVVVNTNDAIIAAVEALETALGGTLTVGGTVAISNATLAVTQSGTWNVGAITTLPTLPTGANIIGRVGIDQTTPGTTDSVTVKSTAYVAQVPLTRPADTNAYLAGDVVGPTSAIITFPSIGPTAGHVLITGADLRIDLASVPSGMTSFELHLYDASPTAIADNAPFDLISGDRAAYLGYLTFLTPNDLGSTLFTQLDNVSKKVKLAAASTSLYGLLKTVGAYTPASGTVYTVRLHTVAV